MSIIKTITTIKVLSGCKDKEYCRFDMATIRQQIITALNTKYQGTQTTFNKHGMQIGAPPRGAAAGLTYTYGVYQFSSVGNVNVTPTTAGDTHARLGLCDGDTQYFDPASLTRSSTPQCKDRSNNQKHCGIGCSAKRERWAVWGAEESLGACNSIVVPYSFKLNFSKVSGPADFPSQQSTRTKFGKFNTTSTRYKREAIGAQSQVCTCSLPCY